jgi:hypothetical protein
MRPALAARGLIAWFWRNCPVARQEDAVSPTGGRDDVSIGTCVTSIAGPHGAAQLYGREPSDFAQDVFPRSRRH